MKSRPLPYPETIIYNGKIRTFAMRSPGQLGFADRRDGQFR
ncbi:MAG: hypothetical protein HW419_3879 [Deltaproteobacteria bacterium]|nr:hypothetical protein [Deltaproteobacteria bacterium]